jgi:hypothetical protein
MTEGTQRRLAAVVSADVVGYSRLMGEDEAGLDPTGDILMCSAGNSDTTGFAKCLEPSGDIDAITENIITFDNQIAEVNTDTEDDTLVFIDRLVTTCHGLLDVDHALGGIDDGGELQQQSIAHGLDDTTAVFGNLAIDQFRPMVSQRSKRAGFIHAHQARITDNISGYDGRQPTLSSFRHGASLTAGVRRSHAS